jgi:hypothetical protein
MAQRFFSVLTAACMALAVPCVAHAALPWSEPAVVQGSDARYPLLPRVFATGSSSTLVWTRDPSAGCIAPCGSSPAFAAPLTGVTPGAPRVLLPDSQVDQIGATRTRLIALREPTYGTKGAAHVRTGPAGGSLGAPQALGPASTHVDAALATTTNAAAVALRVGSDEAKTARILLSVAPRAKRFAKPRLVYTDRSNQTVALAAGMNARGDVFVAWERGAEIENAPVEGRFVYASGQLGKVRRLGTGSVWFSRMHVALANDRRVIITWVDQELAADGPGALTQGKLKAAVVTPSGTTRNQVLQAFPGAEEPNDFRALFGSDGTGIAAWAGPKTARFSRLGPTRFAAPVDLGPLKSGQEDMLRLATGPEGRALAVWSAGEEVKAAVIPRNGPPAASETVVAQARNAAPAFDPLTGDPFVALALTGDDGTTRVAISERQAP